VIPSFFIFSKLIELTGSGDLRPEMDKARRYLASNRDRPVSWRWQFRRQTASALLEFRVKVVLY